MIFFTEYLLFLILVPSLVVYIIFLITLIKFRKKKALDTSFFKICIAVGVFDVALLCVNWFFERFIPFGWFSTQRLALAWPKFFAKANICSRVYLSHGQFFGIFFLSLNRMIVVKSLQDWHPSRTKQVILANVFIPLIPTGIIAFLEFDYHPINNGTDGAELYWIDSHAAQYYSFWCGFICGVMSSSSAAFYFSTYRFARSYRNSAEQRKAAREVKLALVGLVLFLINSTCGMLCFAFAIITDQYYLSILVPFFHFVDDAMCWINPYLLLVCSKEARKYFKAVIMCKNPSHINPEIMNRSPRRQHSPLGQSRSPRPPDSPVSPSPRVNPQMYYAESRL